MNEVSLISVSQRLALLGKLLPEVESAADIGTDHAYLLAWLVQRGKIKKGIGVEAVPGPYQTACQNIRELGLAQVITIRQGDGLAPICVGEVDAAIIAGMGGSTITGILQRSPEVVASLDWLLLQPMSQAGRVRKYLQEKHWQIQEEQLLEERNIIYPLILACPGPMAALSDMEAEYGPLIIKEKPALLRKLLEQELAALDSILQQLTLSHQIEGQQRKKEVTEKYQRVEALLKCL